MTRRRRSDTLHMLVRYASPSYPICLMCLMLTLSGPAELFSLVLLRLGPVLLWLSVVCVDYCVGKLFIECVFYLCR